VKLRKPILGDEGIITLMGALARCDVKGGTVTWPYQSTARQHFALAPAISASESTKRKRKEHAGCVQYYVGGCTSADSQIDLEHRYG